MRSFKSKVSVVLPTHNSARFVVEAIESILGQTYHNIELIIVDSGSTDETPTIISRLRDPRVRVVQQPNLWLSFAINRGVALATGEYIAGMGHDDVSIPNRIETQVEVMRERNLDVCFSWAEIIDGEGQPLDHHLRGIFNQCIPGSRAILEKLQAGNFLLAPSVVCRRHCYFHFGSNVVLFGLRDYALWLQMLRRLNAGIVETPLLKFRVHGGNVSLSRFDDQYRQVECRAALHLASDTPFIQSQAARQSLAHALLESSRGLLFSSLEIGNVRERLFDAYLAANRAVNLDPANRTGYQLVADALSRMGHDEPARIVRSIGRNVDPSLAYPFPLQKPSWGHVARECFSFNRPLSRLIPKAPSLWSRARSRNDGDRRQRR